VLIAEIQQFVPEPISLPIPQPVAVDNFFQILIINTENTGQKSGLATVLVATFTLICTKKFSLT